MPRYRDDVSPFAAILIFLFVVLVNLAWIGVCIWAVIKLVSWVVAQ